MVTDSEGKTEYSEEAKITVDNTEPLTITQQPNDYTGRSYVETTFSVSATGNGELSYQWQYSSDGNNWKDFNATSRPTAKTADFKVKIENRFNGWSFRCVVTDSEGKTEYSDEALITVVSSLTLTSPTSTTIFSNQSATFTVSSDSNITSYAWEYKLPNSNNWTVYTGTGANTASITVAGANAVDGTMYRCTVTDNYGQTKTSDPATLTLEAPDVEIANGKKEIVVTVGEPYQLDLVGKGLKYYSTYSGINVDKNGVITAVKDGSGFVFVVDTAGHKFAYRVFAAESYVPLAFEKSAYTTMPGQEVTMPLNGSAEFLISDPEKAGYSSYWNNNEKYCGYFYSCIPGTYQVIAYNEYSDIDVASVTVEGEVTNATLNTKYSGNVDVNSNVWYKYTNNTSAVQPITFDVTGVGDNNGDILDAAYVVYYADRYFEPDWYYGTELSAELIYLQPGEEIYVNPQANDGAASAYNFSFITPTINTVNYTIGSEISNYALSNKNINYYTFTVSETSVLGLNTVADAPFKWEVRSTGAESELVTSGYSSYDNGVNSVLSVVRLNAGTYTLSFTPSDIETGSLSFAMSETEDGIKTLNLREKVSGVYTDSNNFDLFVFEAPHAGRYSFESFGDSDSYGHLYSDIELTNEIAHNDDGGSGNNFKIDVELTEGQVVYLKPRAYSQDNSISYQVRVIELARTMETLSLDTPAEGEYFNSEAFDFFEFTAPSSGNYIFRSTNSNGNNWVGELYDDQALGNMLAFDYYSGQNGNFVLQYSLEEGQKVYLAAFNDNSGYYAGYTVTVTKRTRVEKDILLGNTYDEALASESEAWYEFTAPFDGRYYFDFDSDTNISGLSYYVNDDNSLTEIHVWGSEIYQTKNDTIQLYLSAGQKIAINIMPDDLEAAANYSLSLRCDIDDYEVQALDIDADELYSSSEYYFDRVTGWLQINSPTLCEGVLTVETLEADRRLTVDIYNANGVLITSGNINNETDTITNVDFEDPFLADDALGNSVFFLKIRSINGYAIDNVSVVFENASVQDGGLDD